MNESGNHCKCENAPLYPDEARYVELMRLTSKDKFRPC